MNNLKVLGIETSCDETAASVVEKTGDKISVLSNVVSSQIEIHKKYGGVVPEVAAREHVLNILPVIEEASSKWQGAGGRPDIDAIAVTVGPGLITSLLAGVETAKTLSYAWGIPVTGVNHVEGHIAANFISRKQEAGGRNQAKNFPILILTVSGGHTMLVLMKDFGDYEMIGETRDDAAGEAFDKAAKLMGLGYPGGPAISALAEKNPNSKIQTPNSNIKLPRPMINSDNFDFSFSGLKTAIRYAIEKDPTPLKLRGASSEWQERISDYCHEFQQAVVDVLVHKTIKAAKKFDVKTVMLAGGVAANKELREQLASAVKEEGLDFKMPELKYTTDNAAMIAAAGAFKAEKKELTPWSELRVDCNLEL